MSFDIKVTKGEVAHMLSKRGYQVDFNYDARTMSIQVTFKSNKSKEVYILPRTYNPEFTHHEIGMDVLEDMLEWSGLKLKATLDY